MRRPGRPVVWAAASVPLLVGAGLLLAGLADGGAAGAVWRAEAARDGADGQEGGSSPARDIPAGEPTGADDTVPDGEPAAGTRAPGPAGPEPAAPPLADPAREPEPAPAHPSTPARAPDPSPAPPPSPAPAGPAPAAPAPAPASPAPEPAPTSAAAMRDVEGRLLALVDDARRTAGVAPLQAHDGLADVARRWSERLAVEGRSLAHNPDYATQVPGGWSAVGENVAWIDDGGTMSPEEVARRIHQGWMDSAGHRENILRPGYTHLGVGVGHHPAHGWYLTQNFATY